jgi:hypothetical protein
MKTRLLTTLVASATAVAAAVPALANDNCATPTPIAGSITVPFDLTNATLDAPGINNCANSPAGFTMDTWFCWTSDVTGMVTIGTCGLTDLDTGVAIYPASLGCSCPGDAAPLCCNDDAGGDCGKQSKVTCEVECGVRYMIQVAARPNGAVPTGQVRIETQGQPCGGGNNEPVSCGCCGGRPSLVDHLSTPFDPGLVAAVTNFDAVATDPALWLVDLGGQGSAPTGTNWSTDRYSHPQWTMQNLGGIFGVTLDGAGNIYAAHSAVYEDWAGGPDLTGFGGPGAIYRLDGATGNATLVIKLPQQIAPGFPVGHEYPGLGQLTWSCSANRLYASNFEDGRIYAIDPTDGTGFKVKSTFAHGGLITGTLPDAGLGLPNDPAGYVGLGKRIWAVKVGGNRLYYSTWSQDQGRSFGGPNEIWSVGLDASGNFVPGSAHIEFAMPPRAGFTWSNPVADISFDANCCMLVAERSMYSDTGTNAHDARVMRFCQGADGSWSQDIQFNIGIFTGENSTGGVAYETGGADQVWAVSDAISFPSPMVYGLLGQDSVGQPLANAFWVDLDGVLTDNQKTFLGSLEVNCVPDAQPCEFDVLGVRCLPFPDGTVGYEMSLSITNNSAATSNLLILSDPIFAPNNVIPMVITPGSKGVVNVAFQGGAAGDHICFFATLAASAKQECCSQEVCIDLPECSCFDYVASVHDLPGAGSFEITLNMTNFTQFSNPPGFVGEWVTFAAPGYPVTITPSLVNIPSLPLLASTSVGPITISTALPAGSPITLIVGLHSQNFHPCCFIEIPIVVPAQTGSSLPGDVNADGVVNGADLATVLSNWGLPGPTDVDGDGTTNGQDLATLLANWS